MASVYTSLPVVSLGSVTLGAVTIDAGTAHIGSVTLDTEGGATGATSPTRAVMIGGNNPIDGKLYAATVSSDGAVFVSGGGQTGSTVPTLAIMTGGTDGTNLRAVSVTAAGIQNVIANASENVIGFTTAKVVSASVDFARPANTTAYASGDCVSSSTSAPSQLEFDSCARLSGGTGWIVGFELWKSTLSSTAVSFRAHFFNTAKTPTNDNDALVIAYTDKEEYLGYCDLQVVGNSGFSTSFGVDNTIKIPFVSSDTSLWYVLEVRGSYTPGNAETFYAKVHVLQN